MFTVIFTQAASAELIEAQDWYEGEAAGFGRHFREGIDALAKRMGTDPTGIPNSIQKRSPRTSTPVSLRPVFRD